MGQLSKKPMNIFIFLKMLSNSSIDLRKIFNLKCKTEQRYNMIYSSKNGYLTQLLRLYKIIDSWCPIAKVIGPNGQIVKQDTYSNIPNDVISWDQNSSSMTHYGLAGQDML